MPLDLLAMAPAAAWASGAGPLPFNGAMWTPAGVALIRNGSLLADGTAPMYLETHPELVDNGWITGTFNLPSPIIDGDHFRTTIGFVQSQPPSAGDAEFSVSVIMSDDTVIQVTSAVTESCNR